MKKFSKKIIRESLNNLAMKVTNVLQEQTEEAFRENQENFKEVVSLVKMLLVNSLLEDMEEID